MVIKTITSYNVYLIILTINRSYLLEWTFYCCAYVLVEQNHCRLLHHTGMCRGGGGGGGGHMEKQEMEMKRKLEMETGNGNQKLKTEMEMQLLPCCSPQLLLSQCSPCLQFLLC